ncbi:TPR repeat-containing ClpX C4-type zinc finger protein [Corallococcus coralloides DSM 2259]|uniref:TPR repeat-containing ClpX C4-type zinc finger protein n=1 Tax=Corallococcus coralloides (strain ATCC 25202 / DSM 2259 / NBRC 100086 / M2) TaxID=1144275 RepID=H8MPR5_CORCM|nr:ClpX C4-type zinc finger protein [Corallococcus coralloides]AFE05403.1 TPR repeat-containing ClpX C4-type zinc finger protein [Corallococcus coralloides DSM 2259]
MADNPRELIRAAQTAELQGDRARAAECLEQAAALYQKSGHTSRASQLLRQARQLKARDPDVSPAFTAAMTGNKEAAAYRTVSWGDAVSNAFNDKVDAVVHTLEEPTVTGGSALPTEPGLPKLAGRIAAIGAPSPAEAITPPDGTVSASQAPNKATVSEGTAGIDAGSPSAEKETPASGGERQSPAFASEDDSRGASGDDDVVVPGGMLLPPEEDELDPATGLLRASGAEDTVVPGGLLRPPDEDTSPVHAEPARGRRREKRIIERGPTRADPALDAWCSFCCRPRGEVGDLVAGPAGAFICKGCLGESQGLLGDVVALSSVRKPVPVVEEPRAGVVEMVGHDEVKTLLERTLQAGARCLLLVGPEGCGKSLFFQSLQRRGLGVLASMDALESTPGTEPLLVEDVDRLEPRAQATLTAFLANRPARAVVMSARGAVSSLGLWVRGEGGSLPVPTTAGMIEAVQGTVPVSLLERVQVLLPVRRPTVPELVEVARRTLSLRQPAVTLSEEVLGAFAAEAVRSPRAGHELQALLSRVYAGSWSLEAAQTPAAPSHNPRGGRKGSP